MGQKINPTGLRIGVIKDWESRWYAKKADFGDTLVEDYELREYLLEIGATEIKSVSQVRAGDIVNVAASPVKPIQLNNDWLKKGSLLMFSGSSRGFRW